jgi:hypothetical protein
MACMTEIGREMLKGAPAAFVTIVIGSMAAYIAYRQYKVSHAKLKLDLFEKRCEIYLQAAVFLTQLAAFGPPDDDRAIPIFRGKTGAAEFLFDTDLNDFLREAALKAGLARAQRDHVKKWAEDEMVGLALRFKPYMMLSDWR